MQERPSKLVFWMFFGGLILIVAGNMADYYVSGSHIGTILTVVGFGMGNFTGYEILL